MTVVSVHIADVGLKSLGLIRNPRPGSIPGLLQANAGIAARFGTTPPRPSPGRVGFIAFWQDDVTLEQFEATHPLAAKLDDGLVVHGRPLRMHGSWPGISDDVPTQRNIEHEGPVLVLTLARTKVSRLIPFFLASNPAEKAVERAPGNVFSSAVLRPPFISSVSLWESSTAAMAYAYGGQQAGHPEAITAGRVKPFHHQQAFVRLEISELRGSLAGRNPFTKGAVHI